MFDVRFYINAHSVANIKKKKILFTKASKSICWKKTHDCSMRTLYLKPVFVFQFCVICKLFYENKIHNTRSTLLFCHENNKTIVSSK